MIFREYVKDNIKKDESVIEFGPLTRPLFSKKEKNNVFYADIRSTDEVKKLYSSNAYLEKTGISVDIDSIVDIDYVVKETYKKTFKNRKFDVAYLSHVVEHMPNIIEFFLQIEEVLNDNGRLILIYPDKRYCFDHFRNEVSFRDAYATYKDGNQENSRIAFDFAFNVIKQNNPRIFWDKYDVSDYINNCDLSNPTKYYDGKINNEIDDMHLWPFTDFGFLKFIYDMQRAGYLNFNVEEFYPTMKYTQEFMIVLRKSKDKDLEKTISFMNDLNNKLWDSQGDKDYKDIIKEFKKSIKEYEKNNKIYRKEIVSQQAYIKELENDNDIYRKEIGKQQEYICNLEKNAEEYRKEMSKQIEYIEKLEKEVQNEKNV